MSTTTTGLEIAVIGMSGAFPGAADLEAFWNNLAAGTESLSFITPEEASGRGVPANILSDPAYVPALGGVLEDKYVFDAAFFGYTEKDAREMHPQIRLFHEHAYRALEGAGYPPAAQAARQVGVYAAASSGIHWQLLTSLANTAGGVAAFAGEALANKDFLATHIAYRLNLTGPAMTLNTACSSSLVVLHTACRALLTGECTMALAGAVSVNTDPGSGYLHQQGMILSPDGHCRTFDEAAGGTVPGEGIGVILLKRLSKALEDKDTIHAVIRSTAVNNDGASKAGYHAPAVEGQAAVIRNAIKLAAIPAESITYVEAHGTGTALGDPVEVKALTAAFNSQDTGYCAIGSVKTNIGHLDTAAGMAGLIKTILCLKNRKLVPSLHFRQTGHQLRLDQTPFYVSTAHTTWEPKGNHPLRAGVSSFGIGGTNAHVILEAAPALSAPATATEGNELLLLSAHSASSLEAMCEDILHFISEEQKTRLSDLAYTLLHYRHEQGYRRAVATDSIAGLKAALIQPFTPVMHPGKRPVVWMFPGQGSQYAGMGKQLYVHEPVFRENLDTCSRLLGINIAAMLYGEESGHQDISQTQWTQPVLFAFEYSLACLLQHYGISPDLMIGHSLGEYVAATMAGVFRLEDALAVVRMRGTLMQRTAPGKMIAAKMSREQLDRLPLQQVSVSAYNTAADVTLSGKAEDIDSICSLLDETGNTYVRLQVSHAFHSSAMDPVLAQFEKYLEQFSLSAPHIPFVSCVTGQLITPQMACSPAYWCQQLRHAVDFSQGLQLVTGLKNAIVFEAGPGQVLGNFLKGASPDHSTFSYFNLIPHAKSREDDQRWFLAQLGRSWAEGGIIRRKAFAAADCMRLSLPPYRFDKTVYDIDRSVAAAVQAQVEKEMQAWQRKAPQEWFYIPLWEQSVMPAVTKTWQHTLLVLPGDTMPWPFLSKLSATVASLADMEARLEIMEQQHIFPDRIIYCCDHENIADPYEPVCRLLTAIQVAGRAGNGRALDFCVTGMHIFNATGMENVPPALAALTGVMKVATTEYSGITFRMIDTDGVDADLLVYELNAAPKDLLVACRGRRRMLPVFKPFTPAATENPSLLYKGMCCIITGAFGGMGAAIAGYLAAEYAASLILLVRPGFPPEEQWENVIANGDTEAGRRIAQVQEYRRLGASVVVIAADMTDSQLMAAEIAAAEKTLKPADGIFHCAGLPDYEGVIQRRTGESIVRIMAPKAGGWLTLEHIFQGRDLRFVINFSSLGNVVYQHKYGQAGYNCANEFLDACTDHHRFGKSTFVSAINWDDWATAGMAVTTVNERVQKGTLEAAAADGLLKDGLRNEEGLYVLTTVMEQRLARVAISTTSLAHRIRNVETAADQSAVIPGAGERPVTFLKGADAGNTVAAVFSHLLGIVQPSAALDFFDAGGDSLKAIQLLALIKEKWQVVIPLEYFFSHPTINGITDFIGNCTPDNASPVSAPVAFNDGAPYQLFCFPPAVAYGIAYKKLAGCMPDTTLYAFDFIAGEDRYETYTTQIMERQSAGPYVLFGYSAGGALAWEVARRLEEKGAQVGGVIMLDTYRYRHMDHADEVLQAPFIQGIDDYLPAAGADAKAQVLQNIRDYYIFSNTLISKEPVNGALFLVTATDRNEKQQEIADRIPAAKAVYYPAFHDLCAQYAEHTGAGGHDQMMESPYLEKNASIIRSLLSKILST
ncbi:acyltransferase domain-containing protein [Chitinophaga sp. Mgbs1]|uniref:Acyltransferase domain-containing protein n=1 Tax=Chitinophaga solisilvae TaxID=1233460 RepID=A0A3S1D475_9BACT|nr:acyltransferase domain-containing protein [Chitinophaga solisilvae]